MKKDFAPKLDEARKKMDVLTPEQKKAREEAVKKATDDGKSRREIRAAGEAAVTLNYKQKSDRAEAGKAMRERRLRRSVPRSWTF